MRREVNNFEYGWMNDEPTFHLNVFSVNGIWITVNGKYLYFDIDLDKENLLYTISHSIYLTYPWCGTTSKLKCGEYKTFKGESKRKREDAIKSLILDWFVGMYGSDELLIKHFDQEYMNIKEKYDNEYMSIWEEYYKITQNSMKKFAEDFCLV